MPAQTKDDQKKRLQSAAVSWVYDQSCSNALAELEDAARDLIERPAPAVPAIALRRADVETYTIDIFIAGDAFAARDICRSVCFDVGLCVSVSETIFVYTGGAEDGVRVGLVNYPRFPSSPDALWEKALTLANALMKGLHQHSMLLVAPDRSQWLSRRSE